MLRFNGRGNRSYCDGMTRRHALSVGGSSLVAGLSLPRLLQLEALAATSSAPKAKACIFIFLEGGPSTIDMWDLKPDAPAEIRGPYNPIATSVPGSFVGEKLPRCAQAADKFTILRSHSHKDNGHSTGYHYCLTGYKANFPDGISHVPNNELYPSIGSIVSRELGQRGAVPPYLNMPNPMRAGGPGFYGVEHAPFVIETDPVQPDFEVRDLRPIPGVSSSRFRGRQKTLEDIQRLHDEGQLPGRAGAMAKYSEKAYELITSPAAQKAFDLHAEKESVRAAYGYTSLGQCALLGNAVNDFRMS